VTVDVPYGHAHRLRELEGTPTDLPAEEQATIDALKAEYSKLEAEYESADELPEEVDERLGEIETALAAFEDRPVIYDPAEIVRAGVFVSIDADGNLSVDRGYVRPEDEAPVVVDGEDDRGAGPNAPSGAGPSTPNVNRAVIMIGGQARSDCRAAERRMRESIPGSEMVFVQFGNAHIELIIRMSTSPLLHILPKTAPSTIF
jgi:ParB family transcriptional regulator, chromosome partitioning protein